MAHHILAQSRTQTTLFPEVLEDFVTEDNPVRVVDALCVMILPYHNTLS